MASQVINSSNPINNNTGVQKNAGNTSETNVDNTKRTVSSNEPVESASVGVDFITGTTLGAVDDYQVLVDESPATAFAPRAISTTASGITVTPISSTGVFGLDGRHLLTDLAYNAGSGFTPLTCQIGIDLAATAPAYVYKRGAAPIASGF